MSNVISTAIATAAAFHGNALRHMASMELHQKFPEMVSIFGHAVNELTSQNLSIAGPEHAAAQSNAAKIPNLLGALAALGVTGGGTHTEPSAPPVASVRPQQGGITPT